MNLSNAAIAALLLALSLTGCSSGLKKEDDPGPAPVRAMDDAGEATELFNQARNTLERGQVVNAISIYENLEATYPFGDHAAQARLDVAYAYYTQGDLDFSQATIERYLKLYPQSEQSDYAYYLKGLVNISRGKSLFEGLVPRKMDQLDQAWLRAALADFTTLQLKFPESPFNEDAQARTLQLIDYMAEHELNTARYYYKRSAMVATINRVTAMLEQYPDSRHSPEGLSLLARAHRALGNDESAAEVRALLKERHPDFAKI